MWSAYVGGLSALLAQVASWLDGSYGLAILLVAILARLALMPMTLRAAEQGWHRQLKLQTLRPELERLRNRHGGDPVAHARAVRRLHTQHGIPTGMKAGVLAALIQLPLGLGVYMAVRDGVARAGSFLWIPKLARPDLVLTLIVTTLSIAAMLLNPMLPEQARVLLQWLPVVMTFLMVWHLSAALALYYAGSSSVGLLQMVLLRSRIRNARA